MTWEFDVGVSTHELLRRGVLVADRRHVVVLAETYSEASLLAYALASVDDAQVTELLWCY